jgi:tellurite methyltransferase
MCTASSVQFLDKQFQRQVHDGNFDLNPFEVAALPYLHGRILDFGCGVGSLAVAAAKGGCSIVALDASSAATDHAREVAAGTALPIDASQTDLRNRELTEVSRWSSRSGC